MTTNDRNGCDVPAQCSRRRHAAPQHRTSRPDVGARRRRGPVMAAAGALAVVTIATALGPAAEADGPSEPAPMSAVAPAAAPRTAVAAATASSPAAAGESARQARAQKRASRTSFRPSASPYRFASKRFNRWYAKRYMAYKYHWHRKQFRCLSPLWGKESAWNERAHNSGSGAHGIPQAMPGSKMAAYGRSWRTNPTVQVKWGLAYIRGAYHSPCRAWSFWRSHHWY